MRRNIKFVVIIGVIGIAAAATGVVNINQTVTIVIDVVGTLEQNTGWRAHHEWIDRACDPVGDVLVGRVVVIDVANVLGIRAHPELLCGSAGGVVL